MNIQTRHVDDVTVVDLSGRLDTQTAGPASEEMQRLTRESDKLLLNFENLEFISSAGLRVLLRTAKQLKAAGGMMKLWGAQGVVKEIMDISGFGLLLDLYDSEEKPRSLLSSRNGIDDAPGGSAARDLRGRG